MPIRQCTAEEHPSADELGCYAEGRLRGERKKKVEVHLVNCDDCRRIVTDTIDFIDSKPSAS